jgi:hypothetical protein
VIDGDEPAPASIGAGQPSPAKKMRKPFVFNNLFINTKSKFYNLCKPSTFRRLSPLSRSNVRSLGVLLRGSPSPHVQ